MLSKNIIVLYHDCCTDGFGAAYAHYLSMTARLPISSCKRTDTVMKDEHKYTLRFVDHIPEYNLHYMPVNYSWIKNRSPISLLENIFEEYSPESYKETTVVILDFSFDTDTFELLKNTFERVVMIDHHDTALRKYEMHGSKISYGENWLIVLDKNHSGAYLSYKHFEQTLSNSNHNSVPDSKIPYVFKLIEDRDLWKFKYEDTDSFHEGMQLVPRDLDEWKKKLQDAEEYQTIITNGSYVVKYRNILCNENIKQQTQRVDICYELGGIKIHKQARCVNTLPTLYSNTGSLLCSNTDVDLALMWSINESGNVMCGLRSGAKYNTLPIAEFFGGGGHEFASGFTISVDEFQKHVKTCDKLINKEVSLIL